MMIWLQESTLADPSVWEQFGPFGIVFLIMSGIIVWLARDRAVQVQRADAAEKRSLELYDRLIVNGERLLPVVERVAPIIEANTRALERVRGS